MMVHMTVPTMPMTAAMAIMPIMPIAMVIVPAAMTMTLIVAMTPVVAMALLLAMSLIVAVAMAVAVGTASGGLDNVLRSAWDGRSLAVEVSAEHGNASGCHCCGLKAKDLHARRP
mmetsp:Transcript_4055/g.9545  ORF Transcript_4055/g.9545 Transcript_4055/m.9545 type:complete len:115 (-) Transcript_4055:347-691(-)